MFMMLIYLFNISHDLAINNFTRDAFPKSRISKSGWGTWRPDVMGTLYLFIYLFIYHNHDLANDILQDITSQAVLAGVGAVHGVQISWNTLFITIMIWLMIFYRR